jgi:hypothetical protein
VGGWLRPSLGKCPVAEIIADRQLPFIFASGYGAGAAGPAEKFRKRPILQKPFLIERLGIAIEKTIEERFD